MDVALTSFRLNSDKSAAANVHPDDYGIEYANDEEDEDSQVVVESVKCQLSDVQVAGFLEDVIPITDAASIGFKGAEFFHERTDYFVSLKIMKCDYVNSYKI